MENPEAIRVPLQKPPPKTKRKRKVPTGLRRAGQGSLLNLGLKPPKAAGHPPANPPPLVESCIEGRSDSERWCLLETQVFTRYYKPPIMKLKSLPRRHLNRLLALKVAIETMETEFCKLLHVPSSLIAFRERARGKLVPPALRKQMAAAQQARTADGGDSGFSPLGSHMKRRAAMRSRVKKTATAGWNKLRRRKAEQSE
ncbi:MAG: hypothetical protein QOF48_1048 [Verrucomicrobiota bacterium]|jgi:hypothetical protein